MATPSAILSILVNASTAQATTALSKFDRQIAAVDAKTRKGIRARLGGDFNPQAFNRYTSALDKAAARTRNRAAFKAELGANFNNRAFNQYQSALEKSKAESGLASAGANKFGGAVEHTGRRVVSTAAALGGMSFGLTAIAGNSLNAAAKFQQSMEQIHTQAGASQQEVNRLSEAVVKLAQTTATGPETLALGLYHLESQGLRGAKAMDALRVAAEGAKIGNANLEDVTNGLGAAVVSGIKGTQNYSKAMGQLNAVVGSGDMRMQQLADALGTGLLGPMKRFGVNLKDVGAALAVFGDNNIRGADAGTKLASAIRIMAAPSKAAAKELGTIGITANQLADDIRKKGLVAAFQDLKTHLEGAGLTASQQARVLSLAFGGRQATGVQLLLGQLDRLKQKEKDVGDGAGKFGAAWTATKKTLATQLAQMHATFQSLGITIGNALAPLVPSINKGLQALSKFIQQMRDGKGAGGQFASAVKSAFNTIKSVVTTVVDAFGGLGNTIKILIGLFVATKIVQFGLALKGLFTLISANPIGAFLTGLALLAGALGLVSSKQHQAAVTARDVADAWDTARDAARTLRDSNLAVTQAKLDEIGASKAQRVAQDAATAAARKYGKNSPQYRAALLASKQANLDLKTAQNRVHDSTQDVTTAQRKLQDAYGAAIKTDKQRVQSLQQQIKVMKLSGAGADAIRGKQNQLNDAVNKLSDDQNGLNSALNGMPKSVQSTVSVNVDFISNIAGAITAIGNTIGNAIGGGSSSSRPGHHFSGGLVTRPGYFAGEEAPQHPEIILASNPKYRQRNLGLFAKAGHMLGVPGFAAGGLANAGREVSAVDPWAAKNAGAWAKGAATSWLKSIAPMIQAATGSLGPAGGGANVGPGSVPGHPELNGTVTGLINALMAANPGLSIGTTVAGHSKYTSSGGISDHFYGHAADMVGTQSVMDRAGAWAQANIGTRTKQGIHNPTFSVNAGQAVPASFWGSDWARHVNHVHIAGYAQGGIPGFAKGGVWDVVASAESLGGTGYKGNPIQGRGFSELSIPPSSLNFSALGDLPYRTPLRIAANGKSVITTKQDIGAGSSFLPVMGLYPQTVSDLGLSGGEFHVAISRADGGSLSPMRGTLEKATTVGSKGSKGSSGAKATVIKHGGGGSVPDMLGGPLFSGQQIAGFARIPSQSSDAQIISAQIQNRITAAQNAGNVPGQIKALGSELKYEKQWLAADKAKLRKVDRALKSKGLSHKQRGALLQDKLGLIQEIGTIESNIGQTQTSLTDLTTPAATDTSGGTTADPNQPLIDAINAEVAARDAQTQAIATLNATLAQNTAYMKSVGGIEAAQALKAVSDLVSGEIGGRFYSRSTGSAGDGSVARYGSVGRA